MRYRVVYCTEDFVTRIKPDFFSQDEARKCALELSNGYGKRPTVSFVIRYNEGDGSLEFLATYEKGATVSDLCAAPRR